VIIKKVDKMKKKYSDSKLIKINLKHTALIKTFQGLLITKRSHKWKKKKPN